MLTVCTYNGRWGVGPVVHNYKKYDSVLLQSSDTIFPSIILLYYTLNLYSAMERAEEFKYLGTTLTNQNSIQEEINSRLKLGNACYYSVQNLLSSNLLSKNLIDQDI